jgi:hypothetical protein
MNSRASLRSLAVVATFVGLSACASSGGGPDASAVEAQPIEAILVGDINIDPDPSGTVATFAVDTSIPVACAVVYGTDDSFGSLAVDNDMQGGAHENHGPLLTGLEPDTEYQYILQGSDADGTFYRSDVMTFRTPVAAESDIGTNYSTSATVVGSSSDFSDSFAAELAIDGDLSTEWSSLGDGDDAWIEIQLDAPREISGVFLRTREMSDGTAIVETFTVTIDGGKALGPFEAGAKTLSIEQPVTGQLVRIDAVTTTGGNTGAVEIGIFGTA